MAELVLLGTAQDGGLPHAGCLCRNCSRARRDASFRRTPASAGVASGDDTLLVDATSAFEEQWHALWQRTTASATHAAERYGAPGTVLLTHAHTGHYVGMWQLDRSVLSARGTRVLGPPATMEFLAAQEPWAGMVREGFVTLDALEFDHESSLLPDVYVRLTQVSHRAEWDTDTAAVWLRGPEHSALYLPDIDRWSEWDIDLVEAVESVDVALLDGCFWAAPTRPNVPHPPIRESLERLGASVAAGRSRVIFTHLNHSNPVCDPDSDEARQVRELGFVVGVDGQVIPL